MVQILQETNAFLAINKPAFWVVNDAATAHGNPTVQSWIEKNLDFPLSKNEKLRNGIVHRLDKETSGVLLIAKTTKALESLQKQFADRITQKEYEVLVHGNLRSGGTVNAPIARQTRNRTHFGISKVGRDAITTFKFIKQYKKDKDFYSLLSVEPKTGRTHQIRVHLSHIGYPVVADPLYLGKSLLEKDKVWCERMFLHARSLSFKDPETDEKLTVKAPLPNDLEGVISSLTAV